MKSKLFAGLALALSLLAPAFSAAAKFEVGALQVEQVSSKGPALILIPGLASGPWVWTDTTARLSGQYSIYLLTLPGFDGRKAVPGTTLDSLSKDLATLIESRKFERPVLVGHSLGGTLSLPGIEVPVVEISPFHAPDFAVMGVD
jgi:pimeloyl-ACP methyl ester carboxylesterase